jgi:hypothetical protein
LDDVDRGDASWFDGKFGEGDLARARKKLINILAKNLFRLCRHQLS